ncbi:MAG: TIGR00730 family Rossman fold protein [Candidatus Levybacteria bacterium]|nr:TIGR00730 family Rossman fold protein [Candidatus Levybacteria bacterium]
MKYIAVFCSAQNVDEKYVKAATEFGELLAKNKYHLVWGGTDEGLMKVIADEVKNGGGKLHGVSHGVFQHLARKDADEMIIAKSLGERKAAMLERSNAIIALVGGIGTLDEITEIIELKKTKHHNKPIIFLNTDNFYNGLKIQLQKMKDEGFLESSLGHPLDEDLFYFADTPNDAIEYIKKKLK